MQYLGYCTAYNSFNRNRLFKPTHKQLTPGKDSSSICVTPPSALAFFSFLFAFPIPKKKKKTKKQKTKRNCLSSDLSLSKIQKLSRTIAIFLWLQLAATASHASAAGGSSGTFLSLSFGRWSCYRRCHHHWWPPGPPLSLYCLFSFIFLFVSLSICLLGVTESLRVLFSD